MREELKLYFRRLTPLLILFVGLPLLSFLIWRFFPDKKLQVILIDKTVPNRDYREHAGVIWALNHGKFKMGSGEEYLVDQDYYGFFPAENKEDKGVVKDLEGKSEEEIKKMVSESDIVVLSDTYGVYESDFGQVQQEKKIYGGLGKSEIELIRQAKEQGKYLIAEFNSMASPTPKSIRSEFENLMGVKWTGWIARYFDELNPAINEEIPLWLVEMYSFQEENWGFSGPGMVFIRDTGEVEVFVYGTDYQNKVPLVRTQKMNKHGYKLPQVIPYPDWIDIVLVERDYQVISYFDIDPSTSGYERLRKMGLPRFFPSAVFREINGGRQYYFSGDFSDMDPNLGYHTFAGLPMLWRGFYVTADHTNRHSFYWNYFQPLLEQVFDQAANKNQ
ncbi:hypothetical protein Aoki45_07200 [Algoriphagus sp. oki45]|uniref:hypothetical protein n=1 Tax=Algoriphagus sp. oki45 TaxID=3067294 RepID=UPI0027EB74B8|nr:hypothetical protein Aoki45_07200 [Algoriphagus sp. oki45]